MRYREDFHNDYWPVVSNIDLLINKYTLLKRILIYSTERKKAFQLMHVQFGIVYGRIKLIMYLFVYHQKHLCEIHFNRLISTKRNQLEFYLVF